MSVNAGVSGGARQVFVFSVRYVLMCARVAIFLGETEVDDVHQVALLTEAHEKVVGLDVTMNEVFRVNVLNAADLTRTRHTLIRRRQFFDCWPY